MELKLFAAAIFVTIAASCSNLEGPCDIYESYGTPAVAAHSTTRILFSKYDGPLYQIQRESDGATLDIYAKKGYADAHAQDTFSEGTISYITIIYDQSGHGNHLYQAAPGTFNGPAKGNFNTLPIADMAPVTINGHKAYGAYFMPGMGFRNNNARDLAIDDEAEGIYYVIDGTHYDSGCCFDYGNSSTNGTAVGTGTMETTYYGTSTNWGSGNGDGPWIMADMESGLFSGYDPKKNDVPSIDGWRFVSVYVNGGDGNRWDLNGGDATKDEVITYYNGVRPHTPEKSDYFPMHKKGALLLGNGGDNGNGSAGTFYEGVMTIGYPSQECIRKVQVNIAAARYDVQPMTTSRLTTFEANSSQQQKITFTNTTGKAISDARIEISLPDGWSYIVNSADGGNVEPGATITADIEVIAPREISGGYLTATASWKGGQETISQRIRCASPVKINEVGLINGGFVELYNPTEETIDLSGYEVEITRSGWAPVVAAKLPEGTSIAAGEYFVLTPNENAVSMDASPLTTVFIPVSTGPWYKFKAGETTIPITSIKGLEAGQTISIGSGKTYEEVAIASVGTAATQTILSKATKAGDTIIELGYTSDLQEGSVITISTGQRLEKATVKSIIKVQTPNTPWVFGMPHPAPKEPGVIELTEPLKIDHMEGVDVSCDGTGITVTPALKYAHESGDAIQVNPLPTLCEDGKHIGYSISAKAGTVALYKDGVLIDGVTYGSKQSNSSANGTICRPDIATLEGDQAEGGCLAEAPSSFFHTTPSIVRYPDGVDRDRLCADFSPSESPTPGAANIK